MSSQSLRVLHLEDDRTMNSLVLSRLAEEGHECRQSTRATEILTHLVQFEPQVVLLDIDLPDLDGLHILRQIKLYDASICVIMLAERSTQKVLTDARRAGADGCVFKPFVDFDLLDKAIAQAITTNSAWEELHVEVASRRRQLAPSMYTPPISVPLTPLMV